MDISILVNSCDKYKEVWDPFFKLLTKYWGKELPPVYLNTESESYNFFNVTTINSNCNSWSERLIYCLDKIKSKYVLLMLDDFFIMDYVKLEEFERTIEILESDDKVGGIYLKKIYNQDTSEKYNDRFLIMNKNTPKYYLNFQAAIFKTSIIKQMLIPGFSPWDIEENNNFRKNIDTVLLCDSFGSYVSCSTDIIPYLWALQTGYGVCKSKWLWNNRKLFKKNGLSFKRVKLGYYSKLNYYFDKIVKRLKKK